MPGNPFTKIVDDALINIAAAVRSGDLVTAMSEQEELAEILGTKLPPKPFYSRRMRLVVGGPTYYKCLDWINCNRPVIARGVADWMKRYNENNIGVETKPDAS